MDSFNQAKQLINDSTNIRIAVSPVFQQDSFPASLALFYSLKQLGKKVNLVAENYPKKFEFLVENGIVEEKRADVMVSIKEVNAKFSHLFYEKENGALNIFLKTSGGIVNPDDITLQYLNNFNKGPEEDDLIITIGIEKLEEVEKLLKPNLPSILNIDTSEENKRYGEANIVKKDFASISEIIFDLIVSIEENPFREQTANCLLAGILTASSNLQSPKITASTFQKLGCLSEFGASIGEIKSQLYGKIEKRSIAIFAKILHKLKINPSLDFAWAILPKEDFKKTNATSKDLNFALRKLTSGLFPFGNLLVVWEQKSQEGYNKAVFYSQSKTNLHKIENIMKAKRKGEAVLFTSKEIDGEVIKKQVIEAIT